MAMSLTLLANFAKVWVACGVSFQAPLLERSFAAGAKALWVEVALRTCVMPRWSTRSRVAVFEPDQYQLLDFGRGRKLERFGLEMLDRPSPAADGTRVAHPELWGSATARFDLSKGGKGQWDDGALRSSPDADEPWTINHGDSRLMMQLSPSGNVGVFPEQASNWDWIAEQVGRCGDSLPDRPPRVLNLFAYTGGASLAAATAGAEVTHVDSSGPTVGMAKKNAAVSGLAELPVRWLVEDAMKFVARESRRGNHYDGIIADPPTYGHGPKGRPFKFRQHLEELMALCSELLGPERPSGRFLLFSCHAPGFGIDDATATVASVLPNCERRRVTSRPLSLETADGRKLAAGVSARWSSTAP